MRKSLFADVDANVNFVDLEKNIQKYWKENSVPQKYLLKNNNSKKTFSFLDGPITANNPMGVHHAWGRTYKDIWQRYKNMKGYKQRFQNGFDCQGLWVEVEVEKELGFKSKRDIESYGIENFVNKCKDRVKKYADIQTQQSIRLGYFMDWNNSYYTLSDDNNYAIWHFLKVCHENGWIYKGQDVVPWCPRCQTAISQHEILTENYKEVVHDSVYFKLPIKRASGHYLLVWTTTPWTIPANIAVSVDAGLDYVLVQSGHEYYWVEENRSKLIFNDPKPIKKVKGSVLEGMEYTAPFENLSCVKILNDKDRSKMFRVVLTDKTIMPISIEEGTGLVHTSTGTGQEDHKLGKKIGLPLIPAIDDEANYLDTFDFLAGKNAKSDPTIVLEYLKDKHFIFKIEPYTHRYPACWRCKEELVWKVTQEWYIAMDRKGKNETKSLRKRMMDASKKIKWIPEFGLERELDWLKNMNDWLISKKNRYWGLALPVWECSSCGNFEVIGSKEELRDRCVSGWEEFKNKSPHKPQIDKIIIKCGRCGKLCNRIEPVGNPWLDAGIVSFSTISSDNRSKPLYFDDQKKWRMWFPADFITESFPGQFKNWFYSLIAMSAALVDEPPFKVVLGFATLLAEDGRPMHKSWGNMIEFNDGAEKIGVDVMRWLYSKQNPSDNLLFGYKVADDTRRSFHLKIWNIYNFFVTYANIAGWRKPSKNSSKKSRSILDLWIISKIAILENIVTKALDNYKPNIAAIAIEEFVNDFSNWYIRRSRDRANSAISNIKDITDFFDTCYYILTNLIKILAPFTPHIAEAINLNITEEKSVHLKEWPSIRVNVDSDLIENMTLIRSLSEEIHALRKQSGIAVRQPLASVAISSIHKKPPEEFLRLLLEEVNVKKCYWNKSSTNKVDLNTKISKTLKIEADTRLLVRKVQALRKELGISVNGKIRLTSDWVPGDTELLKYLKAKTGSSEIVKGDKLKIEPV